MFEQDQLLAPLAPAPRKMLIRGATIISMDGKVGNLPRGDILIADGVIAAIGQNLQADDAEVIDAAQMIAIPGMVDTHRHSWEGQLRRINPNAATLEDYCNATHFSFAKYYRPRDIYVGNLLTALGCIDAGITTVIDNSHNSRTAAHADAAVEALLDAGIRAVHASGAPVSGEWDKAHWPGNLARLQEKYFSDPDRLVTLAMMAQLEPEQWAVARQLGIPIVTEFLAAAWRPSWKACTGRGCWAATISSTTAPACRIRAGASCARRACASMYARVRMPTMVSRMA